MCSSGLAGTKKQDFFDGKYAIRGTVPPRPACGERIEVRGRAQSERQGLTPVLFAKQPVRMELETIH